MCLCVHTIEDMSDENVQYIISVYDSCNDSFLKNMHLKFEIVYLERIAAAAFNIENRIIFSV